MLHPEMITPSRELHRYGFIDANEEDEKRRKRGRIAVI
jgi:hypothetical protein